MRRATITLDDELEDAVESYRRSQDAPVPLTAVTQVALRKYLEEQGFLAPRSRKSFRITPAPEGSGCTDVSDEHDKYFAEAIER